jgi:hypothetical protein
MLPRGCAAIDDEAGACHEAGIVRGEDDDTFGDVGDRAHATDRDARQCRLAGRFEVVAILEWLTTPLLLDE